MPIFVDSNIPMYLIGEEHPNKNDTVLWLEKLVRNKEKLVTNTEVLQEILHRYSAISRKKDIQIALDALYGFVDEVEPVLEKDVLEAKNLLYAYSGLSSRDAVHAAHMQRLKITKILTFDRGFDTLPKIKRLPS